MVTAQATDYLPRKLNPPRVKKGRTSASQAAEKWSEKELIEVFDSRRAGFLELIFEYMNTNQSNNRQRYFYEGDWYTVGHSMEEWHGIRASTSGPVRTMQRYIPELRRLGFIKTHSFYRDWQNGVGSEFRNKKFSYSVNVDLVRETLAKQNGVRIKWKRLLAQHRAESSMYAQTEPTYEPKVADAATFSPQIPRTFLPPRSTQSGGVYLCILNQKQLKNKHVDSRAETGEPIKLALLSREGQLQILGSRFCQSSLASLAPVGRISLFNSNSNSKASAGVEVELVGEANGIGGQLHLLTAFELQGHSAAGKSQNHSDVVSLKNTTGASGGTNTNPPKGPRAAPTRDDIRPARRGRKEPAMPLSTKPPSQRRAERLADVTCDRSGSSFPPSGGFLGGKKSSTPRKNDYSAPPPTREDTVRQAIEESKNLADPATLEEALTFITGKTLKNLTHQGEIAEWVEVDSEVWRLGLVGFREKLKKLKQTIPHPDTAAIQVIKEAILRGRGAIRTESLSAPRTFHPSRVVLGLATPSVEHEHNGEHGYRAIVFYADESHLIQKTIVFSANPITELVSLDALEIIPGLNGAFLPRLAPNETDLALAGHSFPNLKGSK